MKTIHSHKIKDTACRRAGLKTQQTSNISYQCINIIDYLWGVDYAKDGDLERLILENIVVEIKTNIV